MVSNDRAESVPARGLQLILLRHAKSAWPEGVSDEERPLNGRGRAAASLMGDYLAGEALTPDLALVSSARRTRETWALVSGRLAQVPETRFLPALYAASADEILSVLRTEPGACRRVLVLGHNPGLQDLALLLVGEKGGEAGRRMAEKYPTAALAVLDFAAADWHEIGEGQGRLERFVSPRTLG